MNVAVLIASVRDNSPFLYSSDNILAPVGYPLNKLSNKTGAEDGAVLKSIFVIGLNGRDTNVKKLSSINSEEIKKNGNKTGRTLCVNSTNPRRPESTKASTSKNAKTMNKTQQAPANNFFIVMYILNITVDNPKKSFDARMESPYNLTDLERKPSSSFVKGCARAPRSVLGAGVTPAKEIVFR